MPTKLCKWGNSLGLRLSQYVIERTGLSLGDQLFVRLTDAGDIVIRPVKECDVHAGYAVDDAPPKFKQGKPSDEEVLANW
jgi:antitoxin component of MazEF toxin-antitoxin module